MSKIYKYTTVSTGIEIIKSSSVLLNVPNNFNDISDSKMIFDNKNINKCINLILNYFTFLIFKDETNKLYNYKKLSKKIALRFAKAMVSLYSKMIIKQKYYSEIPLFSLLSRFFINLSNDFLEAKNDAISKLKEEIMPQLQSERDKARISCFSKKNNSILMWSHYGDKHSGICIEFDENRPFFHDVNYSKNKAVFNLYEASKIILGYNFARLKPTYQDKKLSETLLEPFYTKSLEWSYEKEVRCILSDYEPNCDGYYTNAKGQTFLKMKISKIFIGAKASLQDIETITSIANEINIPIEFMKEDEFTYSIVSKNI